MMMTETDKHTGRLLLLLSDTLGQHIRLTGVAVAVAVGSVLLNSPCCVRHMRQLAAACNCESKSVRARAGGYCIGVYVCVCACVCVGNSPPSKQNASAKGKFTLLGNFILGAHLNCGNFAWNGTGLSITACLLSAFQVQKQF